MPDAAASSEVLSQMERDWDARARESPEYYIASARREWDAKQFFESGAANVEDEILTDPLIVGRGKKARRMRVLEIGCGAGRMTRALAAAFGEVHAVDISREMIALARRNLAGLPNVVLHKNNGADLAGIADRGFDFAFSFVVFQHIPSLAVIENYVREVHRCLKPGGIFKLQVQGSSGIETAQHDSWLGVPISPEAAQSLAEQARFELIAEAGQGTQYYWLWFLKPRRLRAPAGLGRIAGRVRKVFDRPVRIAFSTPVAGAGGSYVVRIPKFAGQVIDIGYQLESATGIVGRWCELDRQGESVIRVPAEHVSGVVRITKVRSRTRDGRWLPCDAAIEVIGAKTPAAD